ncbi:MAG TPA: FtsX-like permease family protein, partial [bacterium]|nr:FtsX-like permease family protein [bacterium]
MDRPPLGFARREGGAGLRLFSWLSLAYWRGRPLKALLTLLGMAAGIAVFSAIEAANRSALDSFRRSVEEVSGIADLSLVARSRPLRNEDYAAVLANPFTLAATPLVEAVALCGPKLESSFSLLGVDPLSRGDFFSDSAPSDSGNSRPWLEMMAEPGLILLSPPLAQSCGAQEGETFPVSLAGRRKNPRVKILASRSGGASLAFADIATVQELLEEPAGLSRIEVRVRPGKLAEWKSEAERGLEPGLAIVTAEERLGEGRELLKAFQLNLLSLGLVAVFVAVFIVYNASSLALLHRRPDLAVLRALGATRRRLGLTLGAEALLMGLLGGGLGFLLGSGLARLLFGPIARTVRQLYLNQAELRLDWSGQGLAVALGLGLAGALLGTFLPLAEALAVRPVEAARRLSYERHLRHHPLFLLGLSALAFLIGLAAAKLSSPARPAWGFVTAFGVLIGFLLLTPLAMRLVLLLLQALARLGRWGAAQVAWAQVAENPYRYGVVTAALTLGVALWLGVSLMVNSFRGAVVDWIGGIRGDVYLTLRDNPANGFRSFLPPDFVVAVEAAAGEARIDTLRGFLARRGSDEVTVSAIALRDLMAHGQIRLLQGSLDPFLAGGKLFAVSESFARRQRIEIGDRLTLETEWGAWTLPVAAIFHDYSSERGVVYVDRETFQAFSGDRRIQGMALYLKDPSRAAPLIARFRGLAGAPPTLEVRPYREVRSRVLEVFDQTFAVTDLLKYVALFVAFLGVLTTLAILLEEKRREVGLLQALGISPSGLRGYGLSQGLALACCGYALGALAGLSLAWVLLKVLHYDHFGWTIPFHWNPWILLIGLGLTLGVGALATAVPIHWLSRIQPSEALRYEE